MPLNWNMELSVDVTSLDEEHKQLASGLAAFFEGVRAGAPATESLARFDAMVAAVRDHFSREERLMRNIGMAGFEHHQQQHARLVQDVEAFRGSMPERLGNGKVAEVEDFLSHWLFRHITVEDRMIRDHLHADPAARHGLSVASDPASAGSRARPTVLVVDDVAANIQVLAEILKTEYQVLFATSGADALRIARAKEPDLVLLDVMMPDMDGLTVCARLKADPTLDHIPVIFVTAMGEVADETKGLAAGAIDYITKPVSPPIVRSRVRNHLELKRQRDLLRHIALADGLTGIANRRRFDEIFAEEWRRAQRRQASLSLIIGDVDHFKGYNDHYGHQAGDECLKAVAQSMAGEMTRSGDVAARFGGEEFVCLLPDTDRDGARQVAERIRAALTRLALPHEASQVAGIVTLSLGIATTIPKAGTNPGDLLALADSHLYEAKKAGRDRACGGVLETVHALAG